MLYVRWFRLFMSYAVFIMAGIAVYNYDLSIYLLRQAKGQLHVLYLRESFEDFKAKNHLSAHQFSNLALVELIKKYSVDSLGYKPTDNFTRIYDQHEQPILWVITASEKYELKAVEWNFPVIGSVSYKGFFREDLALKEKNKLQARGFDVGIRSVSAWSTLGWFKDPLLSSHLNKSKGSLCNLLFHELFHATFYEAGRINDNENLANFIAHKATLQFLRNDTSALKEYMTHHNEWEKLVQFLHANTKTYRSSLDTISRSGNKLALKQKQLYLLIVSCCCFNLFTAGLVCKNNSLLF